MRREQLPAEAKRSYVLWKYKTVYVSTPKAACTSLKWVVAGLAGEDLTRFAEVIRPGTTPAGTIHPRRYWSRTPRLHGLGEDQLAEIDSSNGWHVFAVVRHPAMRIWSAWQEKVLLQEPHMATKVPAHLAAAPPRTTADVVEQFHRFVAAMRAGECPELSTDAHFTAQYEVLAADRMPYTRIYTTGEIEQLMADLERQVGRHGGRGLPPLPSDNETPLRPLRAMFPPDVLDSVVEIYARDFDTWFGAVDPLPGGMQDGEEYLPSQLAEVGRLVDRHARIGQLARLAEGLRSENQALRRELARARAATS